MYVKITFCSVYINWVIQYPLISQSLILNGGLSKHFIAKTVEYEQPNLNIQIQHKIFTKIEYHINYYAIHTYWPYSLHEIIQWEGDERELYTRQINGIDLNINVLTLLCKETNFGFSVGPTFRRRYETGFELCQYTSGG